MLLSAPPVYPFSFSDDVRPFSRRWPAGVLSEGVLPAGSGPRETLPRQVPRRVEERTSPRRDPIPRLTRRTSRSWRIPRVPRSTLLARLVRVREASLRRPRSRPSISVALHASCRDLEPSAHPDRGSERVVPVPRLRTRMPTSYAHDPGHRVPSPIPDAHASARLRTDTPLRAVGKSTTARATRTMSRIIT